MVIAAVTVVGYVGVTTLLNWRLSSELARDREACTRNQPVRSMVREDKLQQDSPVP